MVIHLPLALVSVATVPLTVIISGFFFTRLEKVYRGYQEQEAVLSTTMQESLTAVRVVRAFARQDHEVEKFGKENRERFRRGRRMLTMYSLFWPCSDLSGGLQHIAGPGHRRPVRAGWSTQRRRPTSPTPACCIRSSGRYANWGRLIIHFSTGIVSTQRVLKVIGEQREARDEGSAARTCIAGRNRVFQGGHAL